MIRADHNQFDNILIDTRSELIVIDSTSMSINIQSKLITIAAITHIQAFIGHLAIFAGYRATLTLSMIRGNHRTLVDHYTVCIGTNCINTDCINADCINMDCINANHVDTYNCKIIFRDTLDRAYKYARVMSSLDFDSVKSHKSSSNIPGSILAGLLLAPMVCQISCQKGLAADLSTQNFLWRRIKGY
jgi:hypothetical protein